MKLLLLLNILNVDLFMSPISTENCQTNAMIIGKDFTKCMCCGGWEIKIGDNVYLTQEIPQFGLVTDGPWEFKEPIAVKIDYGFLESSCDNRIVVLCLERMSDEN